MYGTVAKGVRYLEMAEGYVTRMALDDNDEVIGYEFVHLGKMMEIHPQGRRSQRGPQEGHLQVRPLRRGRPHHQPPARVSRRRNPPWLSLNRMSAESARSKSVLAQYGIKSLEEAKQLCEAKGVDVYTIVKGIQPICFENVCWAYILGAAIALKKGQTKAVDIAMLARRGHAGLLHPGLGCR